MSQQKFEILVNSFLTYTIEHEQTIYTLNKEDTYHPDVYAIVKEEIEAAFVRASQRIQSLEGVESFDWDIESFDTEPSDCF